MDGYITIGTKLDTKGFDKEIAVLEDKLNDIKATLEMADEDKTLFSTREIKEMEAEAQKLENRLDTLRKKQSKLDKQGLSNMKQAMSDVGNSTENVIKKVARWGLAIFSIRSAYMLVRQAVSTISQYDKQISADIQYIRFALASALKPIIEEIIKLVYKLLAYIGYIAKAWFGVNIFANASAKAFQKVNSGINDTNKSAQKLQKTLAGFDEMNILQETGATTTGGGGGGITLPSQDLSNLSEIKLPNWFDKLANYKDIIGGIVGGLIALKSKLGLIKALGIGIAIKGIVKYIEKIQDFVKFPDFNNFIGILEGLTEIIIGVALAFGNLPIAVSGAVGLVVTELVKNYDKITKIFNNLRLWLEINFLGKLKEIFGPIGNLIYLPFESGFELIQSTFENLIGNIKKIVDGIILIFNGNFLGGLKNIFSGVFGLMIAPFTLLKDTIKTILIRIQTFFVDTFNWIKNKFIEPLKTAFSSVVTWIKDKVIKPIKDAFEHLFSWISKLFTKDKNKEKTYIGLTPYTSYAYGYEGKTTWAKGAIYYPPKLAVGGIINQPGRGVPLAIGGAIGGERGAEGVIPLTDAQQMQRLGEAIGKYITVNANITNTMNGRVISRELKQIQNEENFAFNGG